MINNIIAALTEIPSQHSRNTQIYELLNQIAIAEIKASQLGSVDHGHIELNPFGRINLPYHKMGAIDTLDLFGLDELIIFSFYYANRARYKKVADIGANLGLHSIMMAKCGWEVSAFEPDPVHAKILKHNLSLNGVEQVNLFEAAVSDKAGTLEFVRVLGNTTGSHLAGAKSNPYGQLERFPVKVISIADVIADADFIKLDAEGQEKIIILGTQPSDWDETDMIVEVGSVDNATAIYNHLVKLGVNLFSQKQGWKRVASLEGMPVSYKEGSLFISKQSEMPWC